MKRLLPKCIINLNYQIDNLDEFLALSGSMEGKNIVEKKEFERKESEYVKENALKSRPQEARHRLD